MREGVYAVVAAKTSTFLALATTVSVNKKSAVNAIIAASLASGALTKYRTSIDVVGSTDDRKVLMMLAAATSSCSL